MKIVALHELDFRVSPFEWNWAKQNRNAIDEYFARMRAHRPQIWNGRILMLNHCEVRGGKISGTFFETDFANLVAFRAAGFPDPDVRSCAASSALLTADGAFVLGVMAPHTANAGRVYFVAGTPDTADVRADGSVDLAASAVKELGEEAGLSASDVRFADEWHAVFAGARITLIRVAHCTESEAKLSERIRGYIATQQEPELSDIVTVRTRADFSPAMPDFIRAYLNAMLPAEAA
jgi:8-oxo-dGTP pyrophosphatase MutT (NUDIX family)